MRKLISLIIICAFLLTVQITVFGAETGGGSAQSLITFDQLESYMMQSNPIIQKLDMAEKQAEIRYNDTADKMNKIFWQGTSALGTGFSTSIPYPGDVQYALKKEKDLVPDQAKYGWSMVTWNKESAENAMTNALWGVYMGLSMRS